MRLTQATIKQCLYCVECSKMTHNKKYSVKQWIQMVWFYAETEPILLTPIKACGTF